MQWESLVYSHACRENYVQLDLNTVRGANSLSILENHTHHSLNNPREDHCAAVGLSPSDRSRGTRPRIPDCFSGGRYWWLFVRTSLGSESHVSAAFARRRQPQEATIFATACLGAMARNVCVLSLGPMRLGNYMLWLAFQKP